MGPKRQGGNAASTGEWQVQVGKGMVSCRTAGCAGSCPAYVVRKGYQPGATAPKCLKCGAKYPKPPPAPGKADGGGKQSTEATIPASVAKRLEALEAENKRLKSAQHAGGTPDAAIEEGDGLSIAELETLRDTLRANKLPYEDVEKRLAEKRRRAESAPATLEQARAKRLRLDKDCEAKVAKAERLRKQLAEADECALAAMFLLQDAERVEKELAAKEYAEEHPPPQENHKKAIVIDLETLLGTADAPIEIRLGDLVPDMDIADFSPEELAEKKRLEAAFGTAAGDEARKQFEPMLAYLREKAQLQKNFRERAQKKRRRTESSEESSEVPADSTAKSSEPAADSNAGRTCSGDKPAAATDAEAAAQVPDAARAAAAKERLAAMRERVAAKAKGGAAAK